MQSKRHSELPMILTDGINLFRFDYRPEVST